MENHDMPSRKAQTGKTEEVAPVKSDEAVVVSKRVRLSQGDVPSYSLEQALRVPTAISENYGYKPTRPMHVAGAMKMSPTSGPFKALTGAAVAYGLTTAAAQAPEIGITPLGLRIVRPTVVGDDLTARREALLRPKIVGEFLRRYDGAAIPPEGIAKNVLGELGVPAERLDNVFDLIISGADSVGFLRPINGKQFVDLASLNSQEAADDLPGAVLPTEMPGAVEGVRNFAVAPASSAAVAPPATVSVGHGIHINVEIHIAADASSETIEDIFRNMRRYVLNGDAQSDNDSTTV
jgi:hypothetical protein